jgi:predicted ArsR family transcriptional regulator
MPTHGRSVLNERILAVLSDGQPRSATELALALAADVHAIRQALTRLKETHRILKVGYRHEAPVGGWQHGQQVRQVVWALTEHAGQQADWEVA